MDAPVERDGEAGVTRRDVLAAGAAAGASLALWPAAVRAAPAVVARLDFRLLGEGDGWPGWTCPGVANLRRAGGAGLLEAGTDVFPHDPRPVAFAIDRRFRDGEVIAAVTRTGAGAGLVLRRSGPRDFYAAILDAEEGVLSIVRRQGLEVIELARTPVRGAEGPVRLILRASGAGPTALEAVAEPHSEAAAAVSASDDAPQLQGPGDAGVLATARTLFPSSGPPVLPALGNVHLLPYGVQEGQAFLQTPPGQAVVSEIRERSTAVLAEVVVRSAERPRPTVPSVLAATTGAPVRGGARLRVATDVPARVLVDVSPDPRFRRFRTVDAGRTGAFEAALPSIQRLASGRTVFWRARARRRRREAVGPVRSFRVLPARGSGAPARVAIASCATQFGPIFDELARRRPDAFVWQGDLNYPDTLGPLAQTVPGYAGIWREFLANPRMEELLGRAAFVAQRDDHDYGVQDANAGTLVPWGLAPWDALVEPRPYFRFTAGVAELWVLDQRQFKTDPSAPDGDGKTLLGARQRDWLLRTLAASRAAFKVVCSPCTLAPLPANARDGSWASGFTRERELVLDHVARHVGGQTLFVTGDTHWTLAYESDRLVEVRPCPLAIPTPNDITITDPTVAARAREQPGVAYADDTRGHFCLVDVSADAREASLTVSLVRDDGAVAFERTFKQPAPARPRRRRRRRRRARRSASWSR
ncbi:MAG TPA: alkaline phosphatase D family protein [Solirubrobacteraceae bacterium]|nr:alkaline phosphatase D family protein [Solirubrobacteraceae bacterium]